MHGGRLPLFEARKSGRISRAFLEEQPDDAVPRFQYEDHIAALVDDRAWPDSTRAISELRLTLEFESASGWNRLFSRGRLSVDIVDYPGEWLLDLPLLGKSYAEFSRDAFELAELPVRAGLSQDWRQLAETVDPGADADEMAALHHGLQGTRTRPAVGEARERREGQRRRAFEIAGHEEAAGRTGG